MANAASEERAAKKRISLMNAKQEREAAMEQAALQVDVCLYLLSNCYECVSNGGDTFTKNLYKFLVQEPCMQETCTTVQET